MAKMQGIPERYMDALVEEGEYITYPAYIGGIGDVTLADPTNGGERLEFDTNRREWVPTGVQVTASPVMPGACGCGICEDCIPFDGCSR